MALLNVQGNIFPADPILDALDQALVRLDSTGRLVSSNRSWIEFAERNPGRVPAVGDAYLDLFRGTVRTTAEFRSFEEHFRAVLQGRSAQTSLKFPYVDGSSPCSFEAAVAAVDGTQGTPRELIVTHTDIRRQLELEKHLENERERSRAMLDSITDAVFRTDRAGRIEFMNRIAEELTGTQLACVRGRSLNSVCRLAPEDTSRERRVGRKMTMPELFRYKADDDLRHLILRRHDGRQFGVRVSSAPIRASEAGGLLGFTFVLRDVTKAREIADELARQARLDPLTELMNRREFRNRLGEEIEGLRNEANRDGEHVLCYLDLDQFKIVNDTCGHTAGDELLRQVSRVLCREVRATDIVARLGGDEFALLLRGCDLDQAMRVCDSMRKAISSHRFAWQDKSFRIGVSIGVVAVQADGMALEELLSAADSACYAAKHGGRNRVHVHLPEDAESQYILGGMDWVSRIERAIDEDRLRVFAQPIRDVRTVQADEKYSALELLVRLETSAGETICPGAFLPAAERYGKVQQIDQWMLQQAFRLLTEQPEMSDRFEMLSVNLSGLSLCDPSFVEMASAELEKASFDRSRLCFEITETAVISNLTLARRGVEQLRGHGCRFALDDFGSGLSSFVHLRALNVDFVKIDGSFVENLDRSQTDLAIVQSINEIAHTMGKQTVAEYAADGPVMELLRELGVDFVQGNQIETARPVECFL